jgi:hypothetical protein
MPPAIPPAQVSSFALQGTLFLYASLTLYMQFIKLKKYKYSYNQIKDVWIVG